MSNLVAILSDLLHEFLPVKLKQFVNVPKTYQNIFSASSGESIRSRNVCLSENVKGKIANRYISVNDNQTVQWNGPIIARYLKMILNLKYIYFFNV